MNRTIIAIAALLLALAVGVGAFGAHALKTQLSEQMMQVYKTGVEYHFYHALGLLLIGLLSAYKTSKYFNWSAWLLVIGIVLFSGSLYALAISGMSSLGIITPFGGVCFIAGWLLLFIGAWKNR